MYFNTQEEIITKITKGLEKSLILRKTYRLFVKRIEKRKREWYSINHKEIEFLYVAIWRNKLWQIQKWLL